ncbi:MAG TPA: hypothetical protein VFZ32_04475 [Micromonosporaceae bacterium]
MNRRNHHELPLLNQSAAAPIACSLDVHDQVKRVRDWRILGEAALIGYTAEPGRLTVNYAVSESQARILRELVDGERVCCAFARFDLSIRDGQASLVVHGPRGTEQFFDFLYRKV